MMGMVYKDCLLLRKQLSYYLIFFVLYTGLAAAGIFPPFVLPGLVVFVGLMLPMSSFAYDEQARWEKYAASTPAGRSGIVNGRYLFALLVVVGASVVVFLLLSALYLLGLFPDNSTLVDACFVVLACAAVALILDAVILPLLIRFGAEKSRLISVILFVAVFGAIIALGQMEQSAALPHLPGWFSAALPGLLAILSVGGFVLSYCVARHIYARKPL